MAIEVVSSTGQQKSAAASTWSMPPPAIPEGGASFLVGIGPASSAVTASTVTDNAGNVYRLAVRRGTPKPAAGAELWYATNISSASTRISVTLSAASSGSMGIVQARGISTGNALDQTGSSAITANSTSHSASEITPTADNCIVVSFARVNVSTISPIRNLDGMIAWVSTNNAPRTHGMYKIQTAASTATGSWTNGGAGTSTGQCQHAEVIASFFDTAAAAVWAASPASWMLVGVQ